MEYNVVRKPLDTGAYINKSFTLLAIWNNFKKQKPPYIHALVKSLQEKYSSCFSFCFLTRLHSLDNNIQYNNTTTKHWVLTKYLSQNYKRTQLSPRNRTHHHKYRSDTLRKENRNFQTFKYVQSKPEMSVTNLELDIFTQLLKFSVSAFILYKVLWSIQSFTLQLYLKQNNLWPVGKIFFSLRNPFFKCSTSFASSSNYTFHVLYFLLENDERNATWRCISPASKSKLHAVKLHYINKNKKVPTHFPNGFVFSARLPER